MRICVVARLAPLLALVAAPLTAANAQDGPRDYTVLVGAGQDTESLNVFFPDTVRVRVGDTVTWQLNSDEIHTVTFAEDVTPFAVGGPDGRPVVNPAVAFPTRPPGAPVETYAGTGFVTSGIMSGDAPAPDVPANDTFTLTFDTPGTFTYYCLVHEKFMSASVTVLAAGSADADDPDEVEARAREQIEPLLAALPDLRAAAQQPRTEPGPDGSQIVFVKAGLLDVLTPDVRSELIEFLPQDVTVRAGDTVVWGSTGFHTITFAPLPPAPAFVIPEPQADGPPLLVLNLEVLTPAKPSAVYDPQQYFNSADIGLFSMNGASWALTFEEPGVYEYVCAVHEPLGMRGTVTVLPRE